MTRTEAEPAQYESLAPETLSFLGTTIPSLTEETRFRGAFAQGTYVGKVVIVIREACDTTSASLKESTEGNVELATDLDERAFKVLARTRPHELIRVINRGNLDPPKLTFAAEAVSQISEASLAIPVLIQLLQHESALVREGAIYGFENQPLSDEAVDILTRISTDDLSPGVKIAASDVLAEL